MNAFVAGSPNWRNHSMFICSGTPAEARVCIDAFDAANQKLEALLKKMNKAELKKLLKKYLGKQAAQPCLTLGRELRCARVS